VPFDVRIHQAARMAGAKRYIVQSTGFFYGPGTGLASETDLLAINASPGISGSVRTYLQVEERVLSSQIWKESPCATDSFTGRALIMIQILEA